MSAGVEEEGCGHREFWKDCMGWQGVCREVQGLGEGLRKDAVHQEEKEEEEIEEEEEEEEMK